MAHVRIVCGPPCAGKTTYVREHASPDDIILDWDDIVEDLGYPPRHHLVDKSVVGLIADEWRKRLTAAMATDADVWVIRAKPARECRPLATSLRGEIIEIAAPVDVLLARAAERPHPEAHRRLILAWHGARRRR